MPVKKDSAPLKPRASKASEADLDIPATRTRRAPARKSDDESEGFDPIRFSMRRDLEGGSDNHILKIVIYIVIVVAAGVGLMLLIQRFIANQSTSNTTTTSNSSSSSSQSSLPAAAVFASVLKTDTNAGTVPTNDQFALNDLALGSASNSASGVSITKVSYDAYESFARVSWSLSGLTSGLPATSMTYAAVDKTITVDFKGFKDIPAGLLAALPVTVGAVTQISGSTYDTGIRFVISLNAASKFHAAISGSTLILDIKTDAQMSQASTTTPTGSGTNSAASETTNTSTSTTTTASTTSSSSSSSGAPAAPHYDNTSSQTKQYVASAVSTSSITFATSFYDKSSAGFYEYSFGLSGSADTSVPNASAELKSDAAGAYIEVKINNLAGDVVSARGKTQATLLNPDASTNITEIDLKSFTDGTSTYWFRLKHAANFRLRATEKSDDNAYRLLGLQVAN